MTPFSILDLAPINEGSDAAQSFRNTLDLARHAERWGYRRYWLAEHHGMPGIASAATAVLIPAFLLALLVLVGIAVAIAVFSASHTMSRWK